MRAKDVSNVRNKFKGERIFPEPPKVLGKYGIEEWDRLINSLHITDKDFGSLLLACQNFEMALDLHDIITTEKYVTKAGHNRTRKISIAQYCQGKNSQQQVELVQKNKATDNYNKFVKRLNEDCSLTGMEEDSEEVASGKAEELMFQLL